MEPSISSDPPSEPTNVLKRSLELEGDEPEAGSSKSAKLDGSTSHQHLKQTSDADFAEPGSVRVDRLVADLEDELWCPLCAAVLYRVRPPSVSFADDGLSSSVCLYDLKRVLTDSHVACDRVDLLACFLWELSVSVPPGKPMSTASSLPHKSGVSPIPLARLS